MTEFKVKIRQDPVTKDWHIKVYDGWAWLICHFVWQGNAAKNWFGLQGAVDMALDRARKYTTPTERFWL